MLEKHWNLFSAGVCPRPR